MNDPRNSLFMAKVVTVALPCILISSVLQQAAQAEPGTRTVHVTYADLDLANPKGRAEFEKRVRHAINTVCRQRFSRSARAPTQTRACIRAARQSVEGQKRAALAYKGVVE